MKHTVLTHWKLTLLRKHAGLVQYQALGVLEGLWQFAATFCPDGDLTNREDALLAWLETEKTDLVDALIASGWIDREGDRLLVHDWSEHCPKWVIDSRRKTEYEEREKVRKAEWNKAQKSAAAQDRALGRTSAVTSTSTSTSTSTTHDSTGAVASPPPPPPGEVATGQEATPPPKPTPPTPPPKPTLAQAQIVAADHESEVDDRFDEFWREYPARRGRKRYKAKAREQFGKLSDDNQRLAIKAARILARSPDYPPDAFRWLKHGDWLDVFNDEVVPDKPKHRTLTREELKNWKQTDGS